MVVSVNCLLSEKLVFEVVPLNTYQEFLILTIFFDI